MASLIFVGRNEKLMDLSLPLAHIMTVQLHTLCTEDCADRLGPIFRAHKIHHIPITDEEGRLAGIISQTDYERIRYGASLFRNPDADTYNEALLRSLRVSDLMTKDVQVLRPTDTMAQAYQLLKENTFRAIPIVEKGKLVGIVSALDLLHFCFEN